MQGGFLGTNASRNTDVTLVLESAMALGLLAGAYLARRRRYRMHACCQSAIVLANLALIALTMTPTLSGQVIPVLAGKPARILTFHYALIATHAMLGSVAEFGSLYILLAAGTNLLPQRYRIRDYKLWMRSVLALWWVVVVLGIGTYAAWYLPHK